MPEVVFETSPAGRLAVPSGLVLFMAAIFALPAVMLVATTWKDVAENPWLPIVWLGACFPLAVLWGLSRLMTRYALRVFADGSVEVVQPFRRTRMAAAELVAIRHRVVRGVNPSAPGSLAHGWIDFSGRDRNLVRLSARAFAPEQFGAFAAALTRLRPDLAIEAGRPQPNP